MGCDIHLYGETFIDGKWKSIDKWAFDTEEDDEGKEYQYRYIKYDDYIYKDRNYDFFGLLSKGVRSEHEFSFQERGVPFSISPEVDEIIKQWDIDGHSHSYLYIHELIELKTFLAKKTITIEGMMNKDQLAKLNDSIISGHPNYDLLYPYCQWTTDERQVNFTIDIPALFSFDAPLTKIIHHFAGVDGENHRIVFFFDN